MKKVYITINIILLLTTQLIAQPLKKNAEISANISRSYININNIFSSVYANGLTDYGDFFFPTRNGQYMGTATGFVFGIKLPGENYPRVGGNYYNTGLQPGYIKSDGTPSDSLSKFSKVFRVRPDIYPGGPEVNLSDEENSLNSSQAKIRADYESDWNNWPGNKGAPFSDLNKDGIYEPDIDIPGVPGASQTLWYVANDLDSSLVKTFEGAKPIGVEIQVTTWAYKAVTPLNNTIFRKYRFINKSKTNENSSGITYDSMYVSLFADADVADHTDDLVGSDSTLGLCYMYNSHEPPQNYYSMYPEPSLGFQLLQGPVVDSPGDTAILNGRVILNKKNLPATATMYLDRYSRNENFWDPVWNDIEGSKQFYNLMQGKYSRRGTVYYDSVDQRYTHFMFDGDPVKETGWFQKPNTWHDSRFGIASGPFNIAPGDTQEVVFAEFAVMENDIKPSVKSLRFYASEIKNFFDNKLNILDNPPVPAIETSSDKNGITLDWSSDQSSISKIESFDSNGYKFQGYNVYQLKYPLANFGSFIKKLSEFDLNDGIKEIYGLVPDSATGFPVNGIIQNGSDNGISRKITIPYDTLGNNHFIIGKTYYFAVTAYAYNPDPKVLNHSTESYLKIIPVVFRNDYSGKKYSDTLVVNHISGTGENKSAVVPVVTDPQLLSGDKYSVTFDTLNTGDLVWNLFDETKSKVLLENRPLLENVLVGDTSTAIAGLNLFISGTNNPPNGSLWSSYKNLSGEKNISAYGYVVERFSNADVASKYQDLEFRFTGVPEPGASDPNDTLIISGGSIATIYNKKRTIKRRVRIPFELWEVERNRQINIIIESDSNYFNGETPPWGTDGTPLWYRISGPDNIYSVATSYNPYAGTDEINFDNPHVVWGINISGNWRTNNILTLHFENPLTPSDKYIFNTDPFNQLKEFQTIPDKYILYQNYPNPFNPQTTIKYSLPESGFVRVDIFNILGQKVKSFVNEQQATGTHQAVIDFSNYASGVYIYSLNVNGAYKTAKKMILLK